ncbi:Electron transfer flavoprotein large subunit [Candidatus Hodgkinia cicadicola]|uniref:Electron transfer flavoprotein large subunit n=1 Tax=Candidatus Hodgkinia cicadicola TaxID=573658 RepID=A0ABX4MF90_9HYPH|nr:Electron transfer flavoprotein large subunit [Candidatus Hodgkinia cicadicola]
MIILEVVNNRFSSTDQRLIGFATRMCPNVDVLAINCNVVRIMVLKRINNVLIFACKRPINVLSDYHRLSLIVSGLLLKYDIVLVDNNSNLHHILCCSDTAINRCVISNTHDVIDHNVFTTVLHDGKLLKYISFKHSAPWLISIRLFYPTLLFDNKKPDGQPSLTSRVQIINFNTDNRLKLLIYSRKTTGPFGSELPKLTETDIVIAGRSSFGTSENFKKWLLPLALKLDAAIETTRGAVELGCTPSELQIGGNYQVISPKLYITFGISGSDQHLPSIEIC